MLLHLAPAFGTVIPRAASTSLIAVAGGAVTRRRFNSLQRVMQRTPTRSALAAASGRIDAGLRNRRSQVRILSGALRRPSSGSRFPRALHRRCNDGSRRRSETAEAGRVVSSIIRGPDTRHLRVAPRHRLSHRASEVRAAAIVSQRHHERLFRRRVRNKRHGTHHVRVFGSVAKCDAVPGPLGLLTVGSISLSPSGHARTWRRRSAGQRSARRRRGHR